MANARIYVGEIKASRRGERSYAIAHAFSASDATTRYCSRISEDHLVGYLEGATAGRWQSVEIKNGVPDDYRAAFGTDKTHELTNSAFDRILRRAGLSAHYPLPKARFIAGFESIVLPS